MSRGSVHSTLLIAFLLLYWHPPAPCLGLWGGMGLCWPPQLQAMPGFTYTWRRRSRKELPQRGELFMAGSWWPSQPGFAGLRDAGKMWDIQVNLKSFECFEMPALGTSDECEAKKIPALYMETQSLFRFTHRVDICRGPRFCRGCAEGLHCSLQLTHYCSQYCGNICYAF